jgi:hypothetical protein
MPKINHPASDFSLQVYHQGEITKVGLGDYKGK